MHVCVRDRRLQWWGGGGGGHCLPFTSFCEFSDLTDKVYEPCTETFNHSSDKMKRESWPCGQSQVSQPAGPAARSQRRAASWRKPGKMVIALPTWVKIVRNLIIMDRFGVSPCIDMLLREECRSCCVGKGSSQCKTCFVIQVEEIKIKTASQGRPL